MLSSCNAASNPANGLRWSIVKKNRESRKISRRVVVKVVSEGCHPPSAFPSSESLTEILSFFLPRFPFFPAYFRVSCSARDRLRPAPVEESIFGISEGSPNVACVAQKYPLFLCSAKTDGEVAGSEEELGICSNYATLRRLRRGRFRLQSRV